MEIRAELSPLQLGLRQPGGSCIPVSGFSTASALREPHFCPDSNTTMAMRALAGSRCTLSPAAPPCEGCSSSRSFLAFPPAPDCPKPPLTPVLPHHGPACPQGTLMPGGSSVPCSSPPCLPVHPSASWPCRRIRREHERKAPSISLRIKRPRGRGRGCNEPPSPYESGSGPPGAGMSAQPVLRGSGREAFGGISQVWTRYEGRQGWSRTRDSGAERSRASLLPPRCSRAGHPSAAFPPSAARRDHPSQVRGRQGMAGGLRGQRAWGEMLHVHSWPEGTASGLAETGGGGGGRLVAPGDAVATPCAGKAWKGEESPCWMSPHVPAWSQPRAVLTRSSSVPILSCSKMLPYTLLSTLPTIPCRVLPGDWKVGIQGLGWGN